MRPGEGWDEDVGRVLGSFPYRKNKKRCSYGMDEPRVALSSDTASITPIWGIKYQIMFNSVGLLLCEV